MKYCKLGQTWSDNGLHATFVPNLHSGIPKNTTPLDQSTER